MIVLGISLGMHDMIFLPAVKLTGLVELNVLSFFLSKFKRSKQLKQIVCSFDLEF